jgi:hypothetical protein
VAAVSSGPWFHRPLYKLKKTHIGLPFCHLLDTVLRNLGTERRMDHLSQFRYLSSVVIIWFNAINIFLYLYILYSIIYYHFVYLFFSIVIYFVPVHPVRPSLWTLPCFDPLSQMDDPIYYFHIPSKEIWRHIYVKERMSWWDLTFSWMFFSFFITYLPHVKFTVPNFSHKTTKTLLVLSKDSSLSAIFFKIVHVLQTNYNELL